MGWKDEVARDLIALGSIPFFILVFARALIGPYYSLIYQIAISAAILLALSLFFKKSDYYLSRGILLGAFTILFYNDLTYLIFVLLALAALVISSFYLRRNKEALVNGVIVGVVTSLVAYGATKLIL